MFVRHAEPVPPGEPGCDESARPLSLTGRRQAQLLSRSLASEPIGAIWSSPYLRARQTVEPLADALGIAIQTVDDLRERLLSPEPLPDWRSQLREAWLNPHSALPGGESGTVAQRRVAHVMGEARAHAGGPVLLASHGNLIALALRELLGERIDHEFWTAMPLPAVYRVAADGDVTGPGL